METKLTNQKKTRRNWLDLPDDLTVSILSRLGVIDILETAQMVCRTWHRFCKDPRIWRTIDMCGIIILDRSWENNAKKMEAMCRHAVHLGGDNVVNISLENFSSDSLLCDITSSLKKIRRLRLVLPNITHDVLLKVAPKLTLLEELQLSYSAYTTEDLEAIGRHCPLLKSLKLNRRFDINDYRWDVQRVGPIHHHYQVFSCKKSSKGLHYDGDALAIAGTMHNLKHLQIFGNRVTNKGLQAILDGCPCLQSLDLRRCFNLKMYGGLKRRCFQVKIKQLRLPWHHDDSTSDYGLFIADAIVHLLHRSFLIDYRSTCI